MVIQVDVKLSRSPFLDRYQRLSKAEMMHLQEGEAKDTGNLAPEIKAVMTSWHNSYGSGTPPILQFILASVASDQHYGALYVCEPPSTVVKSLAAPVAIGRGSRAVEPLLSMRRS